MAAHIAVPSGCYLVSTISKANTQKLPDFGTRSETESQLRRHPRVLQRKFGFYVTLDTATNLQPTLLLMENLVIVDAPSALGNCSSQASTIFRA
jgi:hypothetical protein